MASFKRGGISLLRINSGIPAQATLSTGTSSAILRRTSLQTMAPCALGPGSFFRPTPSLYQKATHEEAAHPQQQKKQQQQQPVGGNSTNKDAKKDAGVSQKDGAEAAPSLKVERKPWRKFTASPWMMRGVAPKVADAKQEEDPVSVLFCGDKLGPRPILVLDGVVPTFEDGAELVQPYVTTLSALSHKDGVICVPLIYKAGDDAFPDVDVIDKFCEQVVKALDVLGVAWPSVTVGRSVGALVAAKMALLYPERIGGIASLDTPLVSKQWHKNFESRANLLQLLASADPNTSLSVIEEHMKDLISSLEPAQPIHSPKHYAKGDAKLRELEAYSERFYSEVMFNEKNVFPALAGDAPTSRKAAFFLSDPAVKLVRGTKGVIRVDGEINSTHTDALSQVVFGGDTTAIEGQSLKGSSYTTPAHLQAIAHPLLLITVAGPSAGVPDGDMLTHRALFNMRRPTVMKAVKSGGTLMDALVASSKSAAEASSPEIEVPAAAQELAMHLRQFSQRFDLFAGLVKRLEQSSAEMLRGMEGAKSVAGGSAAGGDAKAGGGSKKKKGGEKKKP